MYIYNISPQSAAIHFSKCELDSNFDTEEQIESLCHKSMPSFFGGRCTSIEYRLFDGKDSIILFLYKKSLDEPYLFIFDDIESVIEAALSLPAQDSSLYYADHSYILAFFDSPPADICEFGGPVSKPYISFEYLSEHGNILISSNALSILRSYFLPVQSTR